MRDVSVRRAIAPDAASVCTVLRRSITELCSADHRDDPAILERWLANKTPETVASWIADPGRRVVVATSTTDAILGVGMATTSGVVELNYVSPDARFRGVSRAVLLALENWFREIGQRHCRLISTGTARRFYLNLGYRPEGPAGSTLGATSSQPMTKEL
jgi:GNAT superfamily N-acetyltransferase